MYCSNVGYPMHCDTVDNVIRTGVHYSTPYGATYMYSPEELFYSQGVDVVVAGHMHSYERMWPVYNRKACNGTVDPTNPYRDPPAPVHFVVGAAV